MGFELESTAGRVARMLPFVLVAALALACTANAAYPGKNGQIAFSSNWDGNYNIYTIRTDGSGLTRLTDDLRGDVEPRWSPDGAHIAFMRSEPGTPWGYSLYVMNADGSGQRLLVRASNYDFAAPSWSPDGTQIAYSSGAQGVKIIPASGGPLQRSFGLDNIALDPAWSPDGNTIVWVNSTGITRELFAQLADGRTLPLTRTQSLFETSPAWSPDGRRIVYDDERWIPSDSTGLRTMNPDGTDVAIVPGTRNDRDPQWSPDGTRLVVSSWDSSIQKFDLVTLAPDGSGRAALTHTPADEVDPDWQTLPGPRRSDYKNARMFCVAERDFFGLDAFARRYGGGRKAFPRCVRTNH